MSSSAAAATGAGAGAAAGNVCRHCGSTAIDIDPGRGDAVCTDCGSVLEQHMIVSEVQFEENAHGGESVVGQFVGADGRGGCVGTYAGTGRESREGTLRNAKKKLTWLGEKLRLNQHCVDTSFNFFRMALSSGLTRGRRSELVIGACLYITCRTEGTMHMLIDFSDALLIDVCELGRTYMAITTALCINIPVMDPCVYVLRFASKLELGDKSHDVSVTAARLMQRMKRDWLHTGRRPSGLCGAALLLAARLHGFNRSVLDIVGVVRVHHSTVRKRLTEFKNTPSSSLTLDEFMTVDLEEEVDPPSFINSRRKDKKRLAQLFSNDGEQVKSELLVLRQEIEKQLEDRKQKLRFKWDQGGDDGETEDTSEIIEQMTLDTIRDCVGADMGTDTSALGSCLPLSAPAHPGATSTANSALSQEVTPRHAEVGLGVCSSLMGLKSGTDDDEHKLSSHHRHHPKQQQQLEWQSRTCDDQESDLCGQESGADNELNLDGIDDSEIDSYIMSSREIHFKSKLWLKLNAEYLREQQEKKRQAEEDERLEKEGRAVKRPRKRRKQQAPPTSGFRSAEEAIEKMLHDKKLSNKINYDVLRELGGATGKQEKEGGVKMVVGGANDAANADTGVSEKCDSKQDQKSALKSIKSALSASSSSESGNGHQRHSSVAKLSGSSSSQSGASTSSPCVEHKLKCADIKPNNNNNNNEQHHHDIEDEDDEEDDIEDEEGEDAVDEGEDEGQMMSVCRLLQQHTDQFDYGGHD